MKSCLEDFAILGGEAEFAEPLHVGKPNLGDRAKLLSRIDAMLDSRWFSNNGAFVQEFERRIEDMLQVKHCIAMCNATVGLEITIRALELAGEVIVPSFTFVATAHALQWQEITPVFCDIDPVTHCLDPNHVERMITPRTSAIIGVHVWGHPCPVEALQEIASRNRLKLLYDAAHAFGCSVSGRPIGNFGAAEVFSFHATKFLNTFEGGAVTTNDDALAAKIRLMKNFGFANYDKVIYIGTNGKMSEISAVMGLTGLESLDEFVAVNRANYNAYRRCLRDIPGISLCRYDEQECNNYQYIVLEIDRREASIGRDDLVAILHAENVIARRYFYPGCHKMEPYNSFYPHAGLLLPETLKVSERVLVLPTGTGVSTSDIERICAILKCAVANGRALSEALASR